MIQRLHGAFAFATALLLPGLAYAAAPDAGVDAAAVAAEATATASSPGSAMKLAIVLTIATLAPALILTCTCFARFAIVFSFVRTGLATQGAPPSQVLVGLALFMTLFVMAPTFDQIQATALGPYLEGQIDEKQAIDAATPPLRSFMLERTRPEDLALFYRVSSTPRPATAADVPLRIAIPAFVLSELTTAFRMGLVVLLPFLLLDLVVATILSALGMVMLPPVIVSLPIKLLIFVAADGWYLVVSSLMRGVI